MAAAVAAWARISSRSSFFAASTRASISRWMSASVRSFGSASGAPEGAVLPEGAEGFDGASMPTG